MSSPPRIREREEERRLSLRTLVIASIASATAAIVTSQFWEGGTPIAAAVTPVIVAFVSEMLHRPTEAIARRVTSERTAILPEAGGAAPPPPSEADVLPDRAASEPGSEPERDAPVRVYRRERRPRRRKIAVGVVVTTAVLAFAIAAAAITLPELIAGRSIGKGDRHTTLFPGHKKKKSSEPEEQTAPATPTTPESTLTAPQETAPEETTTTPTVTETGPTETQPTP